MSLPLRFVLVRPRSPGNVGSVARAMKNFGFRDLVLVDPRLHRRQDQEGAEPVFERESRRMAWDAADVLEGARLAPDLSGAVSGCGLVLATAPRGSGRHRNLSPEEAADEVAGHPAPPPALLFGSESSGLTSEELSRCSGVVVIPTAPDYRDLNLAQSAVLLAYLVYRASEKPPAPARLEGAAHGQVDAAAEAFVEVARRAEFLRTGQEPMARELRALFHRAGLSRRETEFLRSLVRRIGAKMR